MSLTERILQFIKTRHARIIGIIALIFFIMVSITGFFILPPYVKSMAVEKLGRQLGRAVTIRSVSLNPYTLSVTIDGLVVKETDPKQTFFSIDSLYVNAAIMSLFKGGPVLKEIRVKKPYLHVVRTAANIYNFSDIIERSKQSASNAGHSNPAMFSLNNISVVDGSVDFIDSPVGKVHTVRALSFSIPFVSDMPGDVNIFVKPMFKANVNGSEFAFGGDTKPFSNSVETSVNINLKDLDMPFYMAYLPVKPRAIVSSGRLDIKMAISFHKHKDRSTALTVSGDVLLKKLAVTDLNKRPVFGFDALNVSIASAEPFERRISFSNIILESPNLTLARNRSGALSIFNFMPVHSGPVRQVRASETGPAVPAASVEAGNIEMRNGVIKFSDAGAARPFTTTLRDIEVRVSHFSSLKDKRTAFSTSLMTESDETVKAEGDIGMTPFFYEGKFSVNSVLLKKYMPYLAKQVLFDITDGKLDLAVNVSYHASSDKPVMSLSAFETSLRNLHAVKRGEKEDFLKVAAFSMKDTSIDLTQRKVDIGVMSTEKGFFLIRKNKDGSLNLATLMSPAASPPVKSAPWTVTVRSLNAGNYVGRVEDLSLTEPFSLDIDRIAIKGKGLSTAKKARGTISLDCRIAKKGTVTASGNVLLEPLNTAMSINIKNLPIAPLQPYIDEKASVLITGGGINAGGKITAGMTQKDGLKAAFKGKIWINNFATADAVNAQDLLKWDTLYLGDMDIRYAPLFVDINDISLTNFYSRIIVNADRTINLREILKPEPPQQQEAAAQVQTAQSTEQPAVAEQKPSGQKMIKISRITLQGGAIDLTDHSVNPTFHSKLSEIGGGVSGLSSEENKSGEVSLRGKYDGYAPLDITGKVNPLRDDLFVDLKFNFKDMDLTPVSPYSGRYAGYTIQEGKLSFQLQYLIVKNKLDSKNNILIDQFKFGDRVESPEATKLPVRLAIALLKDRNGKINLDIPVTGDIHDPKFSISGVVWQIIKNILVKAATSPFALLGAIFGGGGEQLNHIEFDPGISTLSDYSQKKLDSVVKALYERPNLKMDIEGHADTEIDREGLKQYLLSRKVKAQKLKDLVKKRMAAPSIDAVTVTDSEYPEYLKRAYREEKFPKPRNFIGMAKDLPVPEMEKLMLANAKVSEEDLKTLASDRAMAVKDYILKSKQVDPGRIFFVEGKSLEPKKNEETKKSRVDLVLK